MKICFKCKIGKELSEFYKHSMMGDGYLGKCKMCAKKDVADRASRLANNPDWMAKERERCRIKQERYRKLGIAKKATKETRMRWAKNNQHKVNAHRLSSNALKRGEIIKPEKCNRCPKITSDLEKHHHDYSKPILVEWLCVKCHGLTRRK